jgi:hypothetical protein
MKKAAILSITAFYLLLTTGMYVCMVHCAAERLVNTPVMHMAAAMKGHVKDCAGKKDCDCNKKHGNYIIKENIKPAVDIQHVQTAALVNRFEIANPFSNILVVDRFVWQQSNAPPGKSGKAIAIKNHSLLI